MRRVLIIIATFFSPWLALAATDDTDLALFLSYWPGYYDNLDQVHEQSAAERPAKDRNQATKLFIRRVALPAFGDSVFYAEWQAADAPERIIRQRIYAFERDTERRQIRLNLHIWPADNVAFVQRTTGAYLAPSRLSGVTPADMAGIAGCDVFFDRAGDGFTGAMVKGACQFRAPNGTPIYSWSQMRLFETQFEYLDGWFNLDGKPFTTFPGEWYRFRKREPAPARTP